MGKFSENIKDLKWWRQWIYLVVGSFMMALAYVLFITPYKIIPGGVYGIGIVLNYLWPSIMVGTYGLLMDIPLLLIALKLFGARFSGKTIIVSVLCPLMMNALTIWVGGTDPEVILGGNINLSEDVLLACLFGGAIFGLGLGLVFRTNATSGGSDIIAMIVRKYTHLRLSRAVLIVDSSIVLIGLAVFGEWLMPMYSLIVIFMISQVIDYVVDGGSNNNVLFILSEKKEEIEHLILHELDRSGTYISAKGMYSKEDKNMIFLVVSRREVSRVKDYIREVDPRAFIVISNAHDIYGEGFKSFSE
jgi:uncharacterized membrane-anchored protein YitT (DUF2179 family)